MLKTKIFLKTWPHSNQLSSCHYSASIPSFKLKFMHYCFKQLNCELSWLMWKFPWWLGQAPYSPRAVLNLPGKSLQDLYMFIIWGKPQISDWKLRWWKLAIAIHTFLIYILVYLGFETENLDEESWWLWGEINSSFNSAWGQNNLLLNMM